MTDFFKIHFNMEACFSHAGIKTCLNVTFHLIIFKITILSLTRSSVKKVRLARFKLTIARYKLLRILTFSPKSDFSSHNCKFISRYHVINSQLWVNISQFRFLFIEIGVDISILSLHLAVLTLYLFNFFSQNWEIKKSFYVLIIENLVEV